MIQFAFILFHSEVVASTQEKKYTLFKTSLSTHSLTFNSVNVYADFLRTPEAFISYYI